MRTRCLAGRQGCRTGCPWTPRGNPLSALGQGRRPGRTPGSSRSAACPSWQGFLGPRQTGRRRSLPLLPSPGCPCIARCHPPETNALSPAPFITTTRMSGSLEKSSTASSYGLPHLQRHGVAAFGLVERQPADAVFFVAPERGLPAG